MSDSENVLLRFTFCFGQKWDQPTFIKGQKSMSKKTNLMEDPSGYLRWVKFIRKNIKRSESIVTKL